MGKMKMSSFAVLLLLMNICVNLSYAQKPNPEFSSQCKKELDAIVKSEQRYAEQIISSGKSWYMDFTFQAKAKVAEDQKYIDITTNGEVTASAKHRYIKEDQYEIFIDQDDVFTVNSSDKSLMRTASSKEFLKFRLNSVVEIANDSVLKQYFFSNRAEVYDSALRAKLTCYVLMPYNTDKATFEMVKIYVDKNTQMFRKTQVWYNTSVVREMKTATTTINKRGEKQTEIPLPLKNIFIAGNGLLKPPYSRYNYKDLKK